MSVERVSVSFDRNQPVEGVAVDDLDVLLDQIQADPAYQRFPVMVSLETVDREHVLEICVGLPGVSLLIWHHTFFEIMASKGTVEQPVDLAYNFGGSRTDAYDHSAIPLEIARQAAREFVTSGGDRPTCLDWQVPSLS